VKDRRDSLVPPALIRFLQGGFPLAVLAVSAAVLGLLGGSSEIIVADGKVVNKAAEAGTPDSLMRRGQPGGEAADPEHYLLLVTSVLITKFTSQSVALIDRSAYDGVAVPFLHAYDASAIPSAVEMTSKIAEWKKTTGKDLWPWIYLNRMVGVNPSQRRQFETRWPYFLKIQGADLEDKAGARSEFLQYWCNSLRAAKAVQAPGIVVDLEFYNYHEEYNVGLLARETGKKPQEVVDLLRQVGQRMMDIVATEYPTATLWFLFTDLAEEGFATVGTESFYPSPAYVVQGLLDRAQRSRAPLKVISGGEVSLGYCSASLDQLRMKIANRAKAFAPQLQRYPGILELGGTITLWTEPAGKSGWVKEKCAPSDASTVEDLQPYLELLLQSYRYNWVYAMGDGSYYAFDPRSAPRFDAVISKARARVQTVPRH